MLQVSQKNSHRRLPWFWHNTGWLGFSWCPPFAASINDRRPLRWRSKSLCLIVSTSNFDLKSSGNVETVLPHNRRQVGHGNGKVLSFWVNVIRHRLQKECRQGKLFGSRKISRHIPHVVRLRSTSTDKSKTLLLAWLLGLVPGGATPGDALPAAVFRFEVVEMLLFDELTFAVAFDLVDDDDADGAWGRAPWGESKGITGRLRGPGSGDKSRIANWSSLAEPSFDSRGGISWSWLISLPASAENEILEALLISSKDSDGEAPKDWLLSWISTRVTLSGIYSQLIWNRAKLVCEYHFSPIFGKIHGWE